MTSNPHPSLESASRLWSAYKEDSNCGSGNYDVWYFGDNETDADSLVELVLTGTKRATASALWAYESDGERIPQSGDFAVVTNWAGIARCVIRTTEVTVVPYNEVTEAFAAVEGEGDQSLKYWRDVHWPYFTREMARIGRDLTEEMPVVCHQFALAYR
jgi:uncharacterized protein YhfF